MATAARRDLRPALAWTAVGVVVAVLVGLVAFGAQLVSGGSPEAAATEAVETLEPLPGVVAVTGGVTDRVTWRQARRDLLQGRDRPEGEVTVDVVVSGTANADEVADVLVAARAALRVEQLRRHAVSITIAQQTTRTQVFDGWTPQLPRSVPAEADLRAIVDLALTLPEGAWVDLEPASHESGWLGDVGPPYLGILLGQDLYHGLTIQVPVEVATAPELLATAQRLAQDASAAFAGTIALELRTPGGMLVRTATAPNALPSALAEVGALLASVPQPGVVGMQLDSTVALVPDPSAGVQTVPSVTLEIELDPATCAAGIDPERLRRDLEAVHASLAVEHEVAVTCSAP